MAKLRSIEIEPAENGGHVITHRFKAVPVYHKAGPSTGMGMDHKENETHVFGPEEAQQHKVLTHIAQALGFKKVAQAEAAEDREGGEK